MSAYAPQAEPGGLIDLRDIDLPLVATDPAWRGRGEAHPFHDDDDDGDGEPVTGPMAWVVAFVMVTAAVTWGVILGWWIVR